MQKDEIGKVLAKGLAHVYTHKPAAPIKYLAKWLQTYSTNQRELQKIIADEKLKTENSHVYAKAL